MAREFHFTRDYLQQMRNEASSVAAQTENVHWRRAWEALAAAADRLDAMKARSTVLGPVEPGIT